MHGPSVQSLYYLGYFIVLTSRFVTVGMLITCRGSSGTEH